MAGLKSATVRMIGFTLNGAPAEGRGGESLLEYLRDVAGITSVKNACGEGACGACSVLVDGKALASCTIPLEKVEGRSVTTVEGIEAAEMEAYVRAFSEAGAVQCGFCTPGMVIAAKTLIDANPDPDEAAVRAGIRRNLCRCTGYAKIVSAILLAAKYRREVESARPASAHEGDLDPREALAAIGGRLRRVDAELKARGQAKYTDDYSEPLMLHGAVLRSPHPRARLLSLEVSAARDLAGVAAVLTWREVPGSRLTGHVVEDWPALVAVGEETRCVGDAIALVAAESPAIARAALGLIEARYEILEPLRSPSEALAPGAPALHPGGNVLSRLELKRGDAVAAIAAAAHSVSARYSTPFTDHAFMESECAIAHPPDRDGRVLVRTGSQSVYDDRRYIAAVLGIPEERVRVVSSYVGGGFGGKEDPCVQHHAALLAWAAGRPVKLRLSREESLRVHVKRHAMEIEVSVGCDREGRLAGIKASIVADTGAYASLGGPVLHRAVTHAGGPYVCPNVDLSGVAVYTNNPPAGAFRGFGVPQVAFALESALDELALRAGLSPWELRFLNAARPGEVLTNGQVAGPDAALEECLLAVKAAYEAAPGRSGLACALKNTGLGVGHPDVGRCAINVMADRVLVLTGAACVGQGLATVLTQIACSTLGLAPDRVQVALPDTDSTPDSGTTTASRQTLFAGEACRKACAAALEALRSAPVAPGTAASGEGAGAADPGFALAALAGREFAAEYRAETDPFDSEKAEPVRHVAYSYACQLVTLDKGGRLERVVAAHDSGLVVNPLAFEAQVEGGVVMGLGYALTEDFPLADCAPTARFGHLGLLRAPEVPPIETIIVRKAGSGSAVDGGVAGAAYGAKGIGEISTIPAAAAVANAYRAFDGHSRRSLPLEGTPYSRIPRHS